MVCLILHRKQRKDSEIMKKNEMYRLTITQITKKEYGTGEGKNTYDDRQDVSYESENLGDLLYIIQASESVKPVLRPMTLMIIVATASFSGAVKVTAVEYGVELDVGVFPSNV